LLAIYIAFTNGQPKIIEKRQEMARKSEKHQNQDQTLAERSVSLLPFRGSGKSMAGILAGIWELKDLLF